jgi:large subunit ribosomal protein L25
MAAKFEITAESREVKGKGASRRLRHAGRVPAVIYGAGKAPQMVTLDQIVMKRHLDNEKFHTAILDVKVGSTTDQAILRDWQMHPYKPVVLHVDLQRISATEKLHMRVPLHFIGQDVAPGVKLEGGIATHLMAEVDITCLPKDLPEFLEVDMSSLHLHQSLHLSDIKLPAGVVITSLAHGGDDLAVAAITIVKVVEEVAPVVAEVAAPAEGAAAAAPAAEGEKKAAEGEKKPAAAEAEKKPAEKKPAEKKK